MGKWRGASAGERGRALEPTVAGRAGAAIEGSLRTPSENGVYSLRGRQRPPRPGLSRFKMARPMEARSARGRIALAFAAAAVFGVFPFPSQAGAIRPGAGEGDGAVSSDLARERALVEEANERQRAFDLPAARAKAKEAVEALLARPAAGRDASWLSLLNDAGRVAWRAEDAATSRAALEAVLAARERLLSADHLDLQAVRLDLALAMNATGDQRGALALQEKALEVLARTLPDEHPELQRARQGIGVTRYGLGDFDGARAHFEKTLEVQSRTLPETSIELLNSKQNVAAVRKAQGDLPGALVMEESILEILSKTLPEDSLRLQGARQNLATTLKRMGDPQGARPLEERVLEVRARVLPENHPDLLAAKQNLAQTLYELGDLPAARALFLEVLDVRTRTVPNDHPDLQTVRLNLAAAIKDLGDLAGARALEETVLEIRSRTLPDDHPRLQAARQNLASTLKAMGDPRAALELETKVLEVRSRTLPEGHPELAAARQNLAATLRLVGDPVRARELEEKVLAELVAAGLGDDHPDLVTARQNLAITAAALGDLERARALDESVLAARVRTLPEDHPDLRMSRVNLLLTMAELRVKARAAGNAAGAESERFESLAAAFTRSLASSSPEILFAASSREAEARCGELAGDLGLALSFAAGFGVFGPSEALDREAFLASEGIRSAGLAAARFARGAASHPRYGEQRRRMLEASEALALAAREGAGSAGIEAARLEREAAERELMSLARSVPATSRMGARPDLAAYSSRLASADAMAAFRRYTRSSAGYLGFFTRSVESFAAFVLRPGGRLVRVELGPVEPIEAAVREWRRAIGAGVEKGVASAAGGAGGAVRGAALEGEPAPGDRDAGEALRRLVFDPLLPALSGASRVVVALDDVLHLVPLDALPLGDSGSLAGDRLRIDTRATLAELLWEFEPYSGESSLLALGGADFGGEAGARAPSGGASYLRGTAWEGGFGALAHTGLEARAVESLHAGAFGGERRARVLERTDASRESLFELAPGARYLHVATHGWFAPESIRSWSDPEPLDAKSGLGLRMSVLERVRGMSPMLLCGLALAGANRPPGAAFSRAPGLVTAEEIAALDLRNCELAVLSACDTNVGERRAGQGVASLQKALHMAGARSVVTSLWKVPDEATKELMLEFYRRLWVEKEPKARALWEAKRKLREAKDERGEPRYTVRDWAAWVLTGDPE